MKTSLKEAARAAYRPVANAGRRLKQRRLIMAKKKKRKKKGKKAEVVVRRARRPMPRCW